MEKNDHDFSQDRYDNIIISKTQTFDRTNSQHL